MTQTHWRNWGSGPRQGLLLHCMLAHSGAWGGVAQALGDVMSLGACDLPGHGQSADPVARLDFFDQATAMAAAGLTAPTDLIGHSFGAIVALRLAQENPEKIRSLTLIEPVLFAAARAAGAPQFQAHLATLAPYEAAMGRQDFDAAASFFTTRWGTGTAWDDLPAPARAYAAARMPLVGATESVLYEDSAGLLAPGRLEGLRCPVLLLEGQASPPVVGAVLSALERRLPNTRRAGIAGARHMLPVTHPAEVADEIRRFLDL